MKRTKRICIFLLVAIVISIMEILPISATESSGTNVALGKDYFYTGECYIDGELQYPDNESKKLTDGVTGTEIDIGFESPIWIGLHLWCGDLANGVNNTIFIDLESVEDDLTKFILTGEVCDAGIEEIKQVEVYVSDNNNQFTFVGTATQTKVVNSIYSAYPTYGIYAYTVTLSTPVSARYIKFMVKHTANWAFVSEVEVIKGVNPIEWNVSFDGEYANGVIAKQTISNLTEKLNTATVKDSKGSLISGDALIGTGSIIIYNNSDYTVVVKGDISGDGKVDAKDYLFAKRAFLGTYTLTELQLKAACFENTVLPTAKDYLKIKRHFLGSFNIYS